MKSWKREGGNDMRKVYAGLWRGQSLHSSPGPVTLLANGMAVKEADEVVVVVVVEEEERREGMNGRDPARNLAMRSSGSIVVRVGIISIMSVMAIVHRVVGSPFTANIVWLFLSSALFNLDLFPRLFALLFDAPNRVAQRLFPS
ncbi:hypothetical protein R1sor_011200 [Riccia sorocarpa]|uniref:Uncharacterized protein n=1 Tax=Riccia sorocarpa TaxID=122646 RepID=A0ABD3I3P4_9MARC